MTSPWSVPVFTNLTIPTGAGPGDARIVIASQLPPPLDTYVPSVPFPTSTGLSAGIIFYSQGDDTTYIYVCGVEDAGPPEVAAVVFGYVVNGVVSERAAGDPLGVVWDSVTTFPNSVRLAALADLLELIATASVNVTADDGNINLSAFDTSGGNGVVNVVGEQSANVTAENVQVRVSFPNSVPTADIVLDSTGILIETLAADPITLDAGSAAVTVLSDIDWGGSETEDGGVDTTSGNTTSAVYVNGTGGAYGQAFVAPPSGEVVVWFLSRLSVNNVAQSGFISPELKDGSIVDAGAVVTAANDADAMRLLPASTTQINKHGSFVTYAGLTPGNSYNVTLKVRSTGGAAVTYNDRRVAISPAL